METIKYLKNPHLVAKIQNYFGVRLCEEKNQENTSYTSSKSQFKVTNKLWFYLFLIGTGLGDELFYSSFIPFWFWNVDGFVGRRFVVVWTIIMYIGQSLKDIICWPRPGYPVVQLQKKWSLEYGMPSTHAMVGISIPFSVFIYTMSRYQYNIPIGFALVTVWCTLICISRLYLGMHTVLDVVAGLALATCLMLPLVPSIDYLDNYLLTSPTSPYFLLFISILMIVYYPHSNKWTPTRGDTTMIVSVCVGVHIGAWLNYQTGNMTHSELNPPYTILWPSYSMLWIALLRTIIGFLLVLLTRQLAKKYSYNILCAILRRDVDNMKKCENNLQNKHKTFVELGCKYITCALIGFNIMYSIPHLFRYLRIERPSFYTEI